MMARRAFRGTVSARRGSLALSAAALSFAACGCGTDDSIPVVVRGQVLHLTQDGESPYTFASIYLRLDNGVWLVDQVVDDKAGRFVLRVESKGDVARYAHRHGGAVRFELVSDTTYGHASCESVALPPLRLAEKEGKEVWLSSRSGRSLPPVTFLIRVGMDPPDLFRFGSGPARAPRTVGCP